MDFPGTYLKHDKVRISWTYAWGRIEDNIFFHCAHFDVFKDDEYSSATHISYHDPHPKYYEVVDDGFGMFLNAVAYDADAVRVYIKDDGRCIRQKGHCRKHIYCTNCYINVFTNDNSYYTRGWCGSEESKKHWADIIYEEDGKPIVDNWEWIGIKLNDGRDIMVYNTERKKYCCLIEHGKARKCKDFWLQANYLNLPEYDLKITMMPIATEKIFSPEVGMKYSEQPFNILSNIGGGVGMREKTYGGIKIDEEYLYKEDEDGKR